MSRTFTDVIYLCYSTNVKRKCKGAHCEEHRRDSDTAFGKNADGSLYYGTD